MFPLILYHNAKPIHSAQAIKYSAIRLAKELHYINIAIAIGICYDTSISDEADQIATIHFHWQAITKKKKLSSFAAKFMLHTQWGKAIEWPRREMKRVLTQREHKLGNVGEFRTYIHYMRLNSNCACTCSCCTMYYNGQFTAICSDF